MIRKNYSEGFSGRAPGFGKLPKNTAQFSGKIQCSNGKVLQFGSRDLFYKLNGISIDMPVRSGQLSNRSMVIMDLQNVFRPKNNRKPQVLYARQNWADLMDFASDAELEMIVLHKKQIRSEMLKENIWLAPPPSFPGKLLALLFRRFEKFEGDRNKGVVIVSPDEDDRAPEIMESVMLEMAHLNRLDPSFLDWIEKANRFCGIPV